jgi:TPP-dependent pyruvate/acetoin dehydrogenase alpha subunit
MQEQNKDVGASVGSQDRSLAVEMLRRMLLIRAFDSKLPVLSSQGLIRGSSHPCIGQEATAVGACLALEDSDYVTSTHRGHGHTIAKGGNVKFMMAELLGRVDGYCCGKGGSMHIADFSIGMLGANGIVGGGIGIAAGAALSAAIRASNQVALCFFGEGAINQGIFLEAGNMAALWKLPLILLCENNQFSMSTRPNDVTSSSFMSRRSDGLSIPGFRVDGMDVLDVFEAVSKAAKEARNGRGPTFIEAVCYRFEGHFLGDGLKYRAKDELAEWKSRDPIAKWRDRLLEDGIVTQEEADQLMQDAESEVAAAIEFARTSSFPAPGSASEHLYA